MTDVRPAARATLQSRRLLYSLPPTFLPEAPSSVGEEGEYLEREFRAMQKVVDRYDHAEIDGDHLRKPRDLVFRGRPGKIEQVEFRHGEVSQ